MHATLVQARNTPWSAVCLCLPPRAPHLCTPQHSRVAPLAPQVVCDFCHAHLPANKGAFESPRLTLVNDDARAQLEAWPGKFDVIIGDLADPLDGGPCYQLYTQVRLSAWAGANMPFLPQHGGGGREGWKAGGGGGGCPGAAPGTGQQVTGRAHIGAVNGQQQHTMAPGTSQA